MPQGGYQLPLDLHPSESRCVTFMLPNDLFYIANFWGAIGELAKWTSYQRTGDDSGLQAAIVMSEVIDAARETFLSGCEGDAPLTPEIIEVVKYILLDNGEDDNDGCEDNCLMCIKCGNAVYYDLESKKKYVMDANCNRIYIDEPATSPDLTGVEDWENAGQPPLPADLPVPHDNPLYRNNTEAQQCAKATAIVEEMWNLISVYTAVEAGQTFSVMMTGLIAWATVQFPVAVPVNLAAAWTGFINTAISALGLEPIVNEMEPIYENTAAKNDIICAIVGKMIPPEQADFSWFGDTVSLPVKVNTIYASDIKAAVDAFKVAFPDADITTKWINMFPLSSWREIVTQKIPATECGCEDYAPANPNEGMGRVVVEFGQAFNNNNFPEGHVSPNALMASTEAGELLSATSIGSTPLMSLSGNHAIGALFIAPEGVHIKKLKFTVQWVGIVHPDKEFDVAAARATTASGSFNLVFEGHNESAAYEAPYTTGEVDLTGVTSPYLWLNYAAYSTDSSMPTQIQISAIRFDLVAADGTWSRNDVPLGTYFQL